MTVMFN